jgi:hypothetical protein
LWELAVSTAIQGSSNNEERLFPTGTLKNMELMFATPTALPKVTPPSNDPLTIIVELLDGPGLNVGPAPQAR